MTNENKVLLWHIIGNEKLVFQYYQLPGNLKIASGDLFALNEKIHEVWYSPTGFGSKDDAESIGYIKLPFCLSLNERECKNYKLSVLGTSITGAFKDDWKKIIEVPGVDIDHQKNFYPFLFINNQK